ncbi:MAG TPA: tRNA lysidine(34) synthetase TilS, partial [Saprospiraceae bacterium]
VVRWPLQLRTIDTGDRFQPLGMQGKTKKLQDYLVDLKLEMHEKQHQLLLTNEDQILWVVGRRLDERAKVDPTEKFIYRISYNGIHGT